MFQGFAELGQTRPVVALVKNTSDVPVNLDALPTYRVYGPDGFVPTQNGTASFLDTKAITDASNTSPIVITSVAHGLTTGARVTITGVLGNTNANTTAVVTKVTDDTFSLDGVAGNGAYISGGVWNVTGLYSVSIDWTEANGYEAGETYDVLFQGLVSAAAWASLETVGVN